MQPVFQVIKGWGERERHGQPFTRGNGDVSKWSLLARGMPAPGSLSAGFLHHVLGRSSGLQYKGKCNLLLLEKNKSLAGTQLWFLAHDGLGFGNSKLQPNDCTKRLTLPGLAAAWHLHQ